MILVSIIIPNYNHAVFLNERIESVLSQTYQNFELIILDDHSSDSSREIIELYKQHPKVVHIEYNERNSGFPSRQWQKGIELAKGEWIWIAESDDVADPIFLESLLSFIHEYPSAGIIYSDSYKEDSDPGNIFKTTAEETNFDFTTSNWDHSHLIKGETAINSYLCKKNIILNASSALIKREYLVRVVTETKAMKYFADWYIYISIAALADIGYCNKLLNTFRRHPGSLIINSEKIGIKKDYFKILDLLLKQLHTSIKQEVLNYFTYNYLKPGLRKEGLISSIILITRFILINPILAIKVINKIIHSKQKPDMAL
jgi:glycosyltransferase involved in cell wall biosynthesis